MRLSIVVPVFNEAATLRAALAPLASLRTAGHELIVVDGGSSDGTQAIAQSLVDQQLADQVVLAPRGRAAQMNAGAALARNEILLFLHVDTQLPTNADRMVMGAIDAGARWGRFDVTIVGRSRGLVMVAALMNWRSRLTGIATGDQAVFVRRDVFRAVGGFPAIALMEDVALAHTLKKHSRPACLHATVATSGRRWDKNGLWRTIFLMWRLRAAYALGASPDRLHAIYYGRPSA